MEKQMETEIENSLQYLGEMTLEEAKEKYGEICKQNNIETTDKLGLALWRQFVVQNRRQQSSPSNSTNNNLIKKVVGFFVSLEAPRDIMAWNRNKAKEEYLRDSDNALNEGIVAIAEENADGKFEVTRYYKGERQQKVVADLHEGAILVEDTFILPLDSNQVYPSGAENKNYGKPLPAQVMRRTGIFYGSVDGGEMKKYNFSYKNDGGVGFQPNTFDWIHFVAILSDDGESLYGMTDKTLLSLTRNDDINPEEDRYYNTSNFEDFETFLVNKFSANVVPLIELDREHIKRQTLPANERFIITDGMVANMNMTPTKNGNRILNITDVTSEIEDGMGITTCWIPEHINIDFGIGSSVIVIGRTSQNQGEDGVEPATINVSSLLVTEHRGSPEVSLNTVEEENYDWF